MDLRSGMVLPEQHDVQFPASWVPGTPAKPVLSKLGAAVDSQGNSAVINWFNSAAGFSDGAAGLRGFEGRAVGLSGSGAAASVPESCISCSNANVALRAQAMGESAQGWHQIRYTELTALQNSAAASSSAVASPPMFIHGSPMHRGEKSSSQLLLNGKVMLSGDLLSDAHSRSQPACRTMTPPFAPVTPEKQKVTQDSGHPESSGSVDEGKMVREGLGTASFLHTFVPKEKGPIQLCFDKRASEQADLVSVELPSQLQENKTHDEAEKQGIDLNKTPQQKPRRKKHRPKVIQEGKPSRTPRSSTPKPATPNPVTTGENVSTKRKYVRRKGLNTPVESPSSGVAGKQVELDERRRTSSAKRRLDFPAEDNKAVDAFHCNTSTRAQEQVEPLQGNNSKYSTGNGNNNDRSTDMFTEGQDVAVNSSAGIAPLLNPSNNQILETYLNSLDIPSLHLQPSRRELIRENLRKLAIIRDGQQVQSQGGISQSETQTDFQLTPEDHSVSISVSKLLSTDECMRRNEGNIDHNLFIDGTQLYNVNVVQADFNNEHSCSYYNIHGPSKYLTDTNNKFPYFADIQKKRRAEKGHSELSFSEAASFADAQRFLEFKRGRAMEGKQAFGQIEVETMKNLKVPIQACNLSSPKDNKKSEQLPAALQNPNLRDERHENGIIQGPQDCVEALSADTHVKARTKRHRKKEQTQVVSVMSSCTSQQGRQEQDFATCSLGQKSGGSVSSSASNSEAKALQSVQASPVQVCDNIRSSHEIHKARLFHGNETLHSVDDIVKKMKHLNIREDQGNNLVQEQTALVPYGADGVIIPFEGQFHPMKKLRHRAKIVLDEETNRVWNLLMGKENNGVEGTAADKEKWWEEERRVFHGRADSFIARMHLVQGDRRFSPWKGSVLDSVIGVFLTQNVSDHLSSSAFMSLAARFPPRSREKCEEANTSIGQQAPCTAAQDVTDRCPDKPACNRNSVVNDGAEQTGEKEMHPSGSNIVGDMFSYSKAKDSVDTPLIVIEDKNVLKENNKKPLEYIHSLQNSVVSSQNSSSDPFLTVDQIVSSSEANSDAEYVMIGNQCSLESKTSFMELLEMAGSSSFQELYTLGNEESSETENFKSSGTEIFNIPSTYHQKHGQPSGKGRLYFPSAIASGINPTREIKILGTDSGHAANATEVSFNQNSILTSQSSPSGCLQEFTGNLAAQSLPASSTKVGYGKHPYYHNGFSRVTIEGLITNSLHNYSGLQDNMPMEILLKQGGADSHFTNVHIASEALSQTQNCRGYQFCSDLPPKETPDTVECFTVVDKSKILADKGIESNSTDEICSSNKDPMGSRGIAARIKRGKPETEKRPVDWDDLRRQVCQKGARKERNGDAMDSLDWEAVRDADINEISSTIRERGMNNKLAERIKGLLDRLMKEHGSIDLEWLRDVPPDKAKDFLLSIKGLGLKSVECVRLLTLHHLAFPVDTNVGRICVRLGWVPLQPLPESLQLHLLELYPMLETIQKYLWPRLCTLDQRTLYELHYQMITFGKVFCTKSKPNCNACPMRGECRHFASAFASARLALPGPEDKSIVASSVEQNHKAFAHRKALPQLEGNSLLQEVHASNNCEPIIEEPATPEPECTQIPDIEDAFYEDPDEIPTIKLNIEEFTQNLQNYMQQNDMELQDVDLSKALIAITPKASIPVPKLKNMSRLRTEHQVYELPDSHPLLEGLDQREAHDPCPYLLAIWTPGETAQSTEPPESCCHARDTGKLCDERTCFSCNSIREAQTQTVRGTLLIPCRTAMRGSFPLNGTYFQVNEVFADHESSLNPIDVPRGLIWNLPRRTVYFGTSVPTIFRGLAIEDIQNCFWRGFVCVRGFDRKTRGPRPLMARLHFPASKANRNKRSAAKDDAQVILGGPEQKV